MEKFDVTPALTSGAWSLLDAAGIKTFKPVYHKSGCFGCCNCCVRTQAIIFLNRNEFQFLDGVIGVAPYNIWNTPFNVGPFDYEIQPGITVEVYAVYLVGSPTNYSSIVWIRTRGDDCKGVASGSPFIDAYINKDTLLVNLAQVYNLDYVESECRGAKKYRETIYKRSNKKFSANSAVTSGSRLERLKLDTRNGTKFKTQVQNGDCAVDCDEILNNKSARTGFWLNSSGGSVVYRSAVAPPPSDDNDTAAPELDDDKIITEPVVSPPSSPITETKPPDNNVIFPGIIGLPTILPKPEPDTKPEPLPEPQPEPIIIKPDLSPPEDEPVPQPEPDSESEPEIEPEPMPQLEPDTEIPELGYTQPVGPPRPEPNPNLNDLNLNQNQSQSQNLNLSLNRNQNQSLSQNYYVIN